MTIICFLFRHRERRAGRTKLFEAGMGLRGRGGAVFVLYLFSKEANIAAALTTVVGRTRLWSHIHPWLVSSEE
jgi:hypothetical protein